MSDEDKADRLAVREAVLRRDGHRCRLEGVEGAGACHFRLTMHHLRKKSSGGAYEPANLVTLCASMNDAVEDDPKRSWEMGLVCRHGEDLAECWAKMAASGLVSYGPDGEPIVPTELPT